MSTMRILRIVLLSAFFPLIYGCATNNTTNQTKTKRLYEQVIPRPDFNTINPIIIHEDFFVSEEIVSALDINSIYYNYVGRKGIPQIVNLVTEKFKTMFTTRSSWIPMEGKKTGVFIFERQWESRVKFAFHAERDEAENQTKCSALYLHQERLNNKNKWVNSNQINDDLEKFLNKLKETMLEVCK